MAPSWAPGPRRPGRGRLLLALLAALLAAGCGDDAPPTSAATVTATVTTPAGTTAPAPTTPDTADPPVAECATKDGWDVRVGRVTSCEFAFAVLEQAQTVDAYDQPGSAYPVAALSPVTGSELTVDCTTTQEPDGRAQVRCRAPDVFVRFTQR